MYTELSSEQCVVGICCSLLSAACFFLPIFNYNPTYEYLNVVLLVIGISSYLLKVFKNKKAK